MEPIRKEIQAGYDKVAAAYAGRFIDEQASKPMDQEMLRRFVKETRGKGTLCDLGCGPGQVGAWMADHLGAEEVIGVDLSARFVEEAQKLHPNMRFYQGDMARLDFPENAWAGATAFYCLIHLPRGEVATALKEIKRVLKPGGVLLITFHIGSETVHITDWFDQQVSMDFVFFEPEEMEGYLKEAGYERIETVVREPYDPDVEHQSKRAYVFARKPSE